MKIEDQVCTLEQAKRLDELGVTTPALFSWTGYSYPEETEVVNDMDIVAYAYTTSELGEMLPYTKCPEGSDWQQRPYKEYYPHANKDMWKFNDPFTKYKRDTKVVEAANEAQARASMLIFLLENKLHTL